MKTCFDMCVCLGKVYFIKLCRKKIYIYIKRHYFVFVSSVWLFIIFHNEIFPIDVTLHRSVLKKKPQPIKDRETLKQLLYFNWSCFELF